MLNTVNALNAIQGRFWLFWIVLLSIVLVYLRDRRNPTGPSIIESLNGLHVAWLGFALCLFGISLMIAGHGNEGDKVFLSGASFIGGVAAKNMADSRPVVSVVQHPPDPPVVK